MRILGFIVSLAAGAVAAAATDSSPVSFYKHVLPILQANCQGCHRLGEAAPMPLLNYQQSRPWAKAIREAVITRRMPPWHADPQHGKFANDRSLSQSDIDTLVTWADQGAREGNRRDSPPPRKFVDGWNIGQPDAVFEMPNDFQVPASGTIDYQYIVIPTGFTEDRWVQTVEARPGNRALVHHIIAFVREPGSQWLKEAKPGEPFVPRRRREPSETQEAGSQPRRQRDETRGPQGEFLIGFAPGSMPEVLEPGQGKLIKAGSDFVFQMHYTANGKPGVDRSRIGLIFSKQPPSERVMTIAAINDKFVIPAGAANHRVDSTLTLYHDSTLAALLPHMHLRGKAFQFRAVYPSGESEILLNVPKFSFSWQLSYYLDKPRLLPEGTRIECTAHFDNSTNNPGNPDATSEVRWGDQSWEEMMIGFMDVAFDAKMDPKLLFQKPKKPATSGE